jgi:hypothetical protein
MLTSKQDLIERSGMLPLPTSLSILKFGILSLWNLTTASSQWSSENIWLKEEEEE